MIFTHVNFNDLVPVTRFLQPSKGLINTGQIYYTCLCQFLILLSCEEISKRYFNIKRFLTDLF